MKRHNILRLAKHCTACLVSSFVHDGWVMTLHGFVWSSGFCSLMISASWSCWPRTRSAKLLAAAEARHLGMICTVFLGVRCSAFRQLHLDASCTGIVLPPAVASTGIIVTSAYRVRIGDRVPVCAKPFRGQTIRTYHTNSRSIHRSPLDSPSTMWGARGLVCTTTCQNVQHVQTSSTQTPD